MRYRTLAGGRLVSALCLGAMNFGSSTDPDTATMILDRFAAAGGTFIDTSNNYNQWLGHAGDSEELLGRWLRDRGNRDEVVIATKCGARSTVPGDPADEHWEGLGATVVETEVWGSLARLGTDRIDLYYAHIDDRMTPQEETVAAFGRLVADGLVGQVGCSNTAAWRLANARQTAAGLGVAPYTVIQQQYTYLWPDPARRAPVRRLGSTHVQHAGVEHFDYLAEHRDVTLVAYSPLLGGCYAYPDRPFPEDRGYAHPTAFARYEELRRVARDLGATPNQVVLAWLLHQDPVIIPLFGASTVGQLDEALDAVDLDLDTATLARLSGA